MLAGLLGMESDDDRIRNSFSIARERGLEFSFSEIRIPKAHPNTVREGKECAVEGASVGGGSVLISRVNGMETSFSGNADTLIIAHDLPGMIAEAAPVNGRCPVPP